jgi:hypothetical protein
VIQIGYMPNDVENPRRTIHVSESRPRRPRTPARISSGRESRGVIRGEEDDTCMHHMPVYQIRASRSDPHQSQKGITKWR